MLSGFILIGWLKSKPLEPNSFRNQMFNATMPNKQLILKFYSLEVAHFRLDFCMKGSFSDKHVRVSKRKGRYNTHKQHTHTHIHIVNRKKLKYKAQEPTPSPSLSPSPYVPQYHQFPTSEYPNTLTGQ